MERARILAYISGTVAPTTRPIMLWLAARLQRKAEASRWQGRIAVPSAVYPDIPQ